jgi:hypothetical protein
MQPLTFSERFVLLSLNQQTGLFNKNMFSVLGFYLAAAGLMELILSDSILFNEKSQVIHNGNHTAEQPHLELMIRKIKRKKRPDSLKYWIHSLYSWNSQAIRKQLLDLMVEQGLLEQTKSTFLFIFPVSSWKTRIDVKESVIQNLREELLGDGRIGGATYALALLSAHANMLDDYFYPYEKERLRRKLTETEARNDMALIRFWHNQVRRAYMESVSTGSTFSISG